MIVAMINPLKVIEYNKASARLEKERKLYADIVDLAFEAEDYLSDEELFDLIDDAQTAIEHAIMRDRVICIESCIWMDKDFSFQY